MARAWIESHTDATKPVTSRDMKNVNREIPTVGWTGKPDRARVVPFVLPVSPKRDYQAKPLAVIAFKGSDGKRPTNPQTGAVIDPKLDAAGLRLLANACVIAAAEMDVLALIEAYPERYQEAAPDTDVTHAIDNRDNPDVPEDARFGRDHESSEIAALEAAARAAEGNDPNAQLAGKIDAKSVAKAFAIMEQLGSILTPDATPGIEIVQPEIIPAPVSDEVKAEKAKKAKKATPKRKAAVKKATTPVDDLPF